MYSMQELHVQQALRSNAGTGYSPDENDYVFVVTKVVNDLHVIIGSELSRRDLVGYMDRFTVVIT